MVALYNDYANEDIPDLDCDTRLGLWLGYVPDMDQSEERVDEEPADEPAVEPSVSPLTSPVPSPDSPSPSPSPKQPEPVVPLPRKPARFGRRPASVNVTQSMRMAGGLGLAAAISAADAFMDLFGQDWEVPSERAGGESRRNENKRKANEITPSAAAKLTNLI